MDERIIERANEWKVGRDTGSSSKAKRHFCLFAAVGAEGRAMIANFKYETNPSRLCVSIHLSWGGGDRLGEIRIPSDLLEEIEMADWPLASGPMTLSGAVAYGLLLSTKADVALRLTGDPSVWPERWGTIIRAN